MQPGVHFMLFFQMTFAQYNFQKVKIWLKSNLNDLGGSAVLVIANAGKK